MNITKNDSAIETKNFYPFSAPRMSKTLIEQMKARRKIEIKKELKMLRAEVKDIWEEETRKSSDLFF